MTLLQRLKINPKPKKLGYNIVAVDTRIKDKNNQVVYFNFRSKAKATKKFSEIIAQPYYNDVLKIGNPIWTKSDETRNGEKRWNY